MLTGNKLRLLRKQKKITIKEVSQRTGMSTSFISQVERNVVNPSVASLKKICDVFDLPLSTFFDDDKFEEMTDDTVVHPEERKKIQLSDLNVEMALLTANLDRKMEMMMVTAAPGGKSGKTSHHHSGEECGLILQGEMEVMIEGKRYHLKKGDSFHFSCDKEHMWRNIGSEQLVYVCAITPPSF